MYFLHLSLSFVIMIDSSTGSPVHILMLSIQAMHGLPHLHYLFLPCIIFFSMQLPCFLTSFLALTVSDSSPFTPAVLRTHSMFSLLSTKPTEFFSVLLSQRCQNMFLHSFSMSSFRSRMLLQATLALSLAISSLKSVCCDFSTFSAVMPCAFSALTLLVGR